MKFYLALLVVIAHPLTLARTEEGADTHFRQVQIHIRRFVGNPCGVGEQYPPKLVAKPIARTPVGQTCGLYHGEGLRIPGIGTQAFAVHGVKLTPMEIEAGKVVLEVTLLKGIVLQRKLADGRSAFLPDDEDLDIDLVRTYRALPLGQTVTVRWHSKPGEPREWMEMTVEEVHE